MLLKNLKRRDHLQELGRDGRILICILNKVSKCGLDSFGSGPQPVVDFGNESSSSIQGREFIHLL
jgi:hypothetical protein